MGDMLDQDIDPRTRAIGMQKLAAMRREGGWGVDELAEYVIALERSLSRYAPTHMAEVWRENQRLKDRLNEQQG